MTLGRPARQRQLQQVATNREHRPVRRIVMLNRVEELKRLDLIFSAVDQAPELRQIEFRVLGDGPLLDQMRQRAEFYPNVVFPGFVEDITPELEQADLFLHCCPVEACSLAVLEAAAAGLPELVPDAGGAGNIVVPGKTGFRFRADDPADMAHQLLELMYSTSAHRRALASAAVEYIEANYQQAASIEAYREMIELLLVPNHQRASARARARA